MIDRGPRNKHMQPGASDSRYRANYTLEKGQPLQQMENWRVGCRRRKADLSPAPCVKISPKLIKDLKVIPETLKPTGELLQLEGIAGVF